MRLREVRSLLAAAGVPPHGVRCAPIGRWIPGRLATLKLNYPKMHGARPDLAVCGRTISGPTCDREHFENREYYNLGCATSATSPPWSTIRPTWCSRAAKAPPIPAGAPPCWTSIARAKGTATIYPNADKGKISDVGK